MSKDTSRLARSPTEPNEIQPLNSEQKRIIAWLRKVRFKKRIFGGVSEKDVWKKLAELNSMYDLALTAERARYDLLLEQQGRGGAASFDTHAGMKGSEKL